MSKFKYRAYIDGIRGISVTIVVLFHTGIIQFRQGFLGVDVFFVLSGYLITSILLSEIERTGWIDLIHFYARRARRILPGAFVTLLLVSYFDRLVYISNAFDHKKCFIAAATYWANYCFILEENDYWSDFASSPVKHFWSLSIEEQFYFLYPFSLLLLFILGSKLNATRSREDREVIFEEDEEGEGIEISEKKNRKQLFSENKASILLMVCFLSVASVLSLGYCLYLSQYRTLSESHMDSLGRVYQLYAGGILAILLFLKIRFASSGRFPGFLPPLFLCGMFILMLYPVVLGSHIVIHPSLSGVLMTVLVLCLIYALENTDSSSCFTKTRFLSNTVFVHLGKWSYSIYLWHFPVTVFGNQLDILPPRNVSVVQTVMRVVVILFATHVLAVDSYYLVERTFMKYLRIVGDARKKMVASLGITIPLLSFLAIYFLVIPPKWMLFGASPSDVVVPNEPLLHHSIIVNNTDDFIVASRIGLYGDSHALRASEVFQRTQEELGIEYQLVQGPWLPPFVIENWENQVKSLYDKGSYPQLPQAAPISL